MAFSRGKLLLGFVIVVALVILASTLGAASAIFTKLEKPNFNDDLEVLSWLSANSEEILRAIRSYEPVLKEIKGYSKCLIAHRHDFWTANKLDITDFIIYRSPDGEFQYAIISIDLYDNNGQLVKQVYVKINPSFKIVDTYTIDDYVMLNYVPKLRKL